MNIKIDLERLEKRCNDPIRAFDKLGEVTVIRDLSYVYIDNNADVLAVAHLDTVQAGTHFFTGQTEDGLLVFNPRLDDRLGAYIILDLLPKLVGKRRYDVLLTTGEESAQSTASYFESERQYRWMFEFDRAGTDVVMYKYDNAASRTLLQSYGFVVGNGSYTDICDLDHLGVQGFNIGCGYKDYHSKMAYANLDHTLSMVRKFANFFNDNAATSMPYVKPVYKPYRFAPIDDDIYWGTVTSRAKQYQGWRSCQVCGYDFQPAHMEGSTCQWCVIAQDADDTQPIAPIGDGNG